MEVVHEEGFCDAATRDKDWIEYAMMLLDGREPLSEYERVRDQILADFFASKTKAELLEVAVKRKLLIGPVATVADVFTSPQLASRSYWEKVDMGEDGVATFPGAIAKARVTPLEPLPRPPKIGEHGEKVFGASAQPRSVGAPNTSRARANGAPLSTGAALAGLKVLDLMWVMAGPASSRVMADYGAEVIRVESMHRIDTARTLAPFVKNEGDPEKSGLFNNLNANKRGLALHLTDPRSREVVLDLVQWADVVVDAFSPHGMGSLGLGHDSLLELKPGLIVASTCLTGQTGPLSALAGFGTMAAAMSGFFYMCGWPDRAPCGPFGAYTDYVSPRYFLCALLAALEHRRRTGQGQYIDFSQSEGSIHNLSSILLDFTVNGRIAERQGNDDERSAPHGVYRSLGEDEWVAIACDSDDQWRTLSALLGDRAVSLAGLTGEERLLRRRELDELITEWSAKRSANAATHELQAVAVPAHPVANSVEALADPQLRHRQHFVEVPHGKLGTTWIEGSRFVLSRTPAVSWRAGPTFGEDTFEILSGTLGYDADRIADLAAAGLLE
jgi:crotonobetainyl-CoA:carnitine CoA-transferase CaiB-like acyl-CoA transferase